MAMTHRISAMLGLALVGQVDASGCSLSDASAYAGRSADCSPNEYCAAKNNPFSALAGTCNPGLKEGDPCYGMDVCANGLACKLESNNSITRMCLGSLPVLAQSEGREICCMGQEPQQVACSGGGCSFDCTQQGKTETLGCAGGQKPVISRQDGQCTMYKCPAWPPLTPKPKSEEICCMGQEPQQVACSGGGCSFDCDQKGQTETIGCAGGQKPVISRQDGQCTMYKCPDDKANFNQPLFP